MYDEATGWFAVEFMNSRVKEINIAQVIRDRGNITALISHDKTHYNFNNVISMKALER